MKHSLLLTGLLAVVSLLPLAQAQAQQTNDPRSFRRIGDIRSRARTQVVRTPGGSPTVYYYTTYVPTGSRIPMVVRRYRGRTGVVNGGFAYNTAYTANDLGITGALDVSTALLRLDPSFLPTTIPGGRTGRGRTLR